MATFASVKKRALSIKVYVYYFVVLLFLAVAAGDFIWAHMNDWKLALVAGGGTAIFITTWWFLFLWQTNVTWLCRVQTMLFNIGALPQDYRFTDSASPGTVESVTDAVVKAAGEEIQESAKKLAANRHTLDKYLGSQASRHAVSGGPASELGGQLQSVFILFSDIRGFTAMTEKLTAQETMRVLNQVYSALGSVIDTHGGEINKFIGDAILAYFKRSENNGPAEAEKAVRAAFQMHERFRQTIGRNAELKAKNIKVGLGIGIVAGQAILGNLGSRTRMEFTLIGDSVNLASRLCGIAPEDEILVNEELAMLVNGKFQIESRMPVQLKGKTEKVTPYSVMGDMSHFSNIIPSVGSSSDEE